jgi:outer membrane protein assembly factor BamD
MVECYLSLGVKKEAQTAAAVLGYNYPGSDWYEDSYNLLVENKVEVTQKPDEKSWISRAWSSF